MPARKKNKKTGLTQRQFRFAEYVLQGMSASKAYVKAGYEAKSASAIRSGASENMTRPNIKSYIDSARKKMFETLELDRTMIQRRLYQIGAGLIDEEVVTSAVINVDENGRKTFEPVVVKKKAGIREQVAALSYLDKAVKEVEDEEKIINTKQEMEDDPITKSIMEQFASGGNNGI